MVKKYLISGNKTKINLFYFINKVEVEDNKTYNSYQLQVQGFLLHSCANRINMVN